MSDITGLYIRRGYIAARAYVQAQDLSQGVLRILVMEGEVEDVRLREGQEGSANLGNAFPGVKGEPLNLRDFEQGLDQINRLRSNRAVLDMAPGEQAGDTVVVIDNTTDRRVHGSLSYDNHGLGSTGEEQVGATLAVDNPLGQNDGLNLSFSRTVGHDFDQRHSRSGALFYSVPYGYFTFTGGYSRSDYATPVELPGTTLISDGNQDSAFFSTDYVAYRDQVNRVSISGTLTARRSHNYLAGQLLEVSSRRLSSFDLGVRWSTSVAGGRLSSHLSYVRGLTWFNAQEDRSDLPDTAPRAQFSKWRAGLSWQRGLRLGGKLFSFRSTLEGQYAEDVLYGAHQFSVGGLYSVRGFRNSSWPATGATTGATNWGCRCARAGWARVWACGRSSASTPARCLIITSARAAIWPARPSAWTSTTGICACGFWAPSRSPCRRACATRTTKSSPPSRF
ncbi:ShlB/FhaC/HecB family hemolysin secretion/activation protein [Alcanivorax sp. IO_7]|nr:ShlB/FhaC/HecB family hemolysin secretion/activation protein [Alcanivorax sp. IO_7]